MSGILMSTRRRAAGGGGNAFNSTAFVADSITAGTSTASATFKIDGTATLVGNNFTSPSSPKWWNNTSPPATWLSYEITATDGASTVVGGLAASTRYQINSDRKIGIQKATTGTAAKTFTISYYDAASGGNLVGTKTLICSVEDAA